MVRESSDPYTLNKLDMLKRMNDEVSPTTRCGEQRVWVRE